ncbi:MAG: glycosyltransferase family 52 [Lachnospiraceae bacterium]|nr:glycosyltransferase family 52 [Lachnospiraceae bacterium]
MKDRIYVCHTYYHVYVAFLKEFALGREHRGEATMVLSRLSNDFGQLKQRMDKLCFWEEVRELNEKRDDYFPDLAPLKEDRGNIVKNMIARMKFTKLYAQFEETYIDIDFTQYKDIYVFCDSDPIGYYLNYKKIPYHAMEDGINCLKIFDAARFDNRGHFKLKVFMASLNLIFIQNGYSKYCIDMEINDRECLKYDCPKYVVVPRKPLEQALDAKAKEIIVRSFVEDADVLLAQVARAARDTQMQNVLILTEPLCDLAVRKQIFDDIIEEYCRGCRIFIKPHPRDVLDYERMYPDQIVIKGKFPLEVMNLIEGIHFHRAISVFTQSIYSMEFVDEIVFLGEDFMDKYEDPSIHRYNDQI